MRPLSPSSPEKMTGQNVSPRFDRDPQKTRVLYRRIVFLGLFLVSLIMYFMIYPKIKNLYQDLGVPIPTITKYGPIIVMVGAFVLAFWDFGKEVKTTPFQGEKQLTKTVPLSALKEEALVMIMLGIFVGLLVISIVLPIYRLTGSY